MTTQDRHRTEKRPLRTLIRYILVTRNPVINTETNLWRDTKSGAYGSIYDLAYELTGSCNMSELNRYIAGQMQGFEKSTEKKQKVEPPKPEQKQEPDKPKRKMRL